MIELRCMGPVRITVDGGEPPPQLLWRKNLALLIYLALTPRGASRDQLIGLLWSEKDETKARHSLNEALRVLRRTLGDALDSTPDRVTIKPNAVTTDLASATGIFLDGFTVPEAPEFERWVTTERERRRSATLEALATQAQRALDSGDLARARTLSEQALAVDPHDEPAAGVLMQAWALLGARSRALAVFGQLATSLKRDLDILPDRETRLLAERVRTNQVVVRRTSVEQEETPLPLVGTAPAALRALIEWWLAGRINGKGQLALVRGDPGTGKTRLLADLAARARLQGCVVSVARALPDQSPDDLWRAWLMGGIAVSELGGAAPTALAGLAVLDPDLAVRFPAAKGSTALPPGDAMTIALLAVADQKPVLVVLDDAHLAPPRVVASLVALVERAKAPIGVALATPQHPPDERLDAIAERLGRDLKGLAVETAAFDEAAVHDLVRAVFPGYETHAADRLARRVLADSAGNPFLAVEMVSAVHAGLVLEDGAAAPAWPGEHRTLDQTLPTDLPESVSAALRVRYRSLTPAAQTALAAVAVLGGTIKLDALARGAGLDRKALDGALDELEWRRWLTADATGYHFLTRLAREVVLADMVTGGQRHRMRERAGLAG